MSWFCDGSCCYGRYGGLAFGLLSSVFFLFEASPGALFGGSKALSNLYESIMTSYVLFLVNLRGANFVSTSDLPALGLAKWFELV
jgi:hypothetical protein